MICEGNFETWKEVPPSPSIPSSPSNESFPITFIERLAMVEREEEEVQGHFLIPSPPPPLNFCRRRCPFPIPSLEVSSPIFLWSIMKISSLSRPPSPLSKAFLEERGGLTSWHDFSSPPPRRCHRTLVLQRKLDITTLSVRMKKCCSKRDLSLHQKTTVVVPIISTAAFG